jgi:uncharacterized membrane protein
MSDTWSRTISKGATWFIIRFTTLFIITYIMSGGDLVSSGTLTTVFYSIGAVLFIAHERVWNKIEYGKN